MFATKLFAAFTFVSFGLVASNPVAAPVPVVDLTKRADNADVMEVFQTLKASTDSILPQIDELTSSGTANDDNVTPLVNELTAALDQASSSLSTLDSSETRKRQTDDELANLVASIVENIANTVQGLTASAITIPGLGGLLVGIDTSLAQVLRGLGTLLAGVLRLVANLLSNLATLLRNLALGLTLGSLGL
ncbi:hypothetical protein PQX77_009872 [Marasmius sp. AFHP31]|nr:hypothetical protein PQX77_009872 [Marasmius sp. AFHP31]